MLEALTTPEQRREITVSGRKKRIKPINTECVKRRRTSVTVSSDTKALLAAERALANKHFKSRKIAEQSSYRLIRIQQHYALYDITYYVCMNE